MTDEVKPETTVKTRAASKPSTAKVVSQLVVELAAIGLCVYLSHEYHDHIEVGYASIGLVAGILGIRIKNPSSVGPTSAILTTALSAIIGGNHA